MSSKPFIKESLLLLNVVGLKFESCSIWNKIAVTYQIATYVYLFVELALQLIFAWEDLDSMEATTAMGMVYQVCSRVFVILTYKKALVRIFSRVEKFWPRNKYGEQLKQELSLAMESVKKYMITFFAVFALSGSLYAIKPFYSAVKALPFLTYHPTDRYKSPQYELMFALQLTTLGYGSFTILGFDALFISLIVYVVCELKMINRGFLTMTTKAQDQKVCLDEITALIDHHSLVLDCINDMATVYSSMLLNQFLSSLICMCAGLLSLIGNGFPPDLEHLAKYPSFVVTILSQLFIYCSAGSYLITESESVSRAVYESDWWVKTQPRVRRAYILVIQRANKTEKLTAGGMFTLNLESFTKVVRTSLSFFTLVQAIYSRTQRT